MKRGLKWLIWIALLAALAVGVGRALNARKAQQAAAAEAAQALKAQTVLSLSAADVLRVQPVTLDATVPLSGSLRAVRSAAVKARVAGEVRELSLREGDAVKAGQVVARIDSTESQARVRQAAEQADAAQAQAAIARRQRDNNQALVDQGFISRTALETSQASLDAALASHKAAVAALDIARKGLADTELRAPIAGLVAARPVQSGERVSVDARILEIVDLSTLELEAALAPADALAVRVGQRAELQIEGAALRVPATVARINPSVQAGSRSVLVYLRLDPSEGLRQGLFAQGLLKTGSAQALAVPWSAVRSDKPLPYVQLVRDGKVAHQTVALGQRGRVQDEDWVAVEPLQAGDALLRVGVGLLREGTPVRTAEPATIAPAAKP